ncbi:hypothetical protein BO71DRAFT_186014 [Aspergillus ellipticus CBS 707.79]|uniref:Uncharacterized protein n=1 Tax=Aspergillus ellipticus CBS 707.79 TaxID=1448320 RepID=A0A319E636_9EURO|nr:hypothetical protein BO71DRAFT_186014 [Aspergillus ellipticus CBS 707.79]
MLPATARTVFLVLITLVDISETSGPLSAIQTLADVLSTVGKISASEALTHALHLCKEDVELSGLSLSPDRPLSDSDREQVCFLVDAWLRASTYSQAQTILTPPETPETPHRPMTLSEKIFTHHLLSDNESVGVKAGDVIRVSVDWIIASELSWMVTNHLTSS